jgi:hypothetical protein
LARETPYAKLDRLLGQSTEAKATTPISQGYEQNVFINCPFDDKYAPLFQALVFAVHDAGFRSRCALELIDAGQVRLDKVIKIISECKYAIHDISRTELDDINHLPRFNMPLELGLDLGCRSFGAGKHKSKSSLILDTEPHRYQKFISDIAGQDIYAHSNSIEKIIPIVRNWLRAGSKRTNIPGGAKIYERYCLFQKDFPEICAQFHLSVSDLPFVDLSYVIGYWLKKNAL